MPDKPIRIKAPMSGSVVDIDPLLRPGMHVAKGAELLILERMKLLCAVTAPCIGTVTAVMTGPGNRVLEGEILIEMVAQGD
ncbi:MAG: acetyl-CoA carboxylase biotin carboxyl carrier protein subunit [Nitrospiraceae bacterium]|nr:acetyl-CoA carboxylase biotin carboxyl carrier protein subunit [Nitrospiraceae bacterium]